MELTALRYFVTVAHELHFHRAAEKLHMTQAPLSAAIRKLEDELEVRLFERTSRSVKLTEAGAFFLPEAEAVLTSAGSRVCGVVINDLNLKLGGKYGYRYGGRYGYKYGYKYGYSNDKK